MTEDSTFVRKEPCPACGSRDNLARYSDGHAHCFGCGHYEHGDGSVTNSKGKVMSKDLITDGTVRPLTKRGITEETAKKFGYTIAKFKGEHVHVAPYYDDEGNLVAQKVRFADKSFVALGDFKKATLFGMNAWTKGGRKVIVTEGEIDALSVSQLQGNKWPVVSVPTGAQGAKKSLSKHLDWLQSFDEVILMFDMDDPGRQAARDCATLFQPGKCKIAKLPLKDANEMLMASRGDEVIAAIWQAEPFRPDGVVAFSSLIEEASKPVEWGIPWFTPRLTELTYGRRHGEVYALGAGTGIGKTDFLTQQIAYDVLKLEQKVGLFFLEQSPVETARRLAGKVAGRRFHIPDAGWTQDELTEALGKLNKDKLFLYDSFGATEWEPIAENIRYLVHAEGVRIFYIDHLTALAAGADDERKTLEDVMAQIAGLAKELNIIIMLISHLATPEGKPHEEGGRVMIKHFKGSRAIGFWCYFMFGLERNQQDADEKMRSITTFRVLKDRYTGNATGEVFYFGYDRETGELYETDLPGEGPFQDETQAPF